MYVPVAYRGMYYAFRPTAASFARFPAPPVPSEEVFFTPFFAIFSAFFGSSVLVTSAGLTFFTGETTATSSVRFRFSLAFPLPLPFLSFLSLSSSSTISSPSPTLTSSTALNRPSSLLDQIGSRTLELVFTPMLSTFSHPSWINPTALGTAAKRLETVCSDVVCGGVAILTELQEQYTNHRRISYRER